MPKRTRNLLLSFGVILSLLLIVLRISSQFGLSDDMRIFSGVLGYEGTKSYAVFLFDQEKDPLLFQFTISNGDTTFTSVAPASSVLVGLQQQGLAQSADILIQRILASKNLSAVDAIGFVANDAAKEVADAFEGFYMGEDQIVSQNLATVIWSAALSDNAADTFNHSISLSKRNMVTHSRAVLAAIKDVFSKKWVAAYFKDSNTFGKPCLGACEVAILEYSRSGVSLNR